MTGRSRIFKKKWVKCTCFGILVVCVVTLLVIMICNVIVKAKAKKQMICGYTELSELTASEELAELPEVDCILVLGCAVWDNGVPSPMLQDRLDTAIALYQAGVAKKLLMSGDHHEDGYDEVNVMKQVAMDAGIPSEDIFMDHAGLSTYDSMARARQVFGVDSMVVVTQEYHLYRAVYLGQEQGITCYGVSASLREYRKQNQYNVREVLARVKAVGQAIRKPQTMEGDMIDIHGSGDATND